MRKRSDVRIYMAPKAYDCLACQARESDCPDFQYLLENPHYVRRYQEGVVIGWDFIDWRNKFKEVQGILTVLEKLDDLITESPRNLKLYFYKLIEIEEDWNIQELTNDPHGRYTSDFYPQCEFSL